MYSSLTTLKHRVPQVVGMGKGVSHADHDFSLLSKVKCAKFHQDRNVGQHRVFQLVQFLFLFIFL